MRAPPPLASSPVSSPRIPDLPSRVPGSVGSSELVIRSGRGSSVATDALLAHIPQLLALADRIDADRHEVIRLSLDASPEMRWQLESCEPQLAEAAQRARVLAARLFIAQGAYAMGDATITAILDALSGWVAAALGATWWVTVPMLMSAKEGAARAWAEMPGTDVEKQERLNRWILDNPQMYTNPEFVDLVRRVADGADDAVLAAAGWPAPLLLLMGPRGLGLLGTDTSARALLAGAAVAGGGALRETPVQTTRMTEQTSAAAPASPSTSAKRFAQIPGERQVLIEKHSAPGEADRFVVFVAPTQSFAPGPTNEPWDLTSNVAGIAGLPSGSMRATEQAMLDAGITTDSQVVFVGYSQGGLVAGQLAASGRWNTFGIETYGAPGGVDLPASVRGMAVGHTDDIVVASGGTPPATDTLLVHRQKFTDPSTIPTDEPVPAHQRVAYAETARMIDGAASPQVRAELDAIAGFTRDYARKEGATITTFEYRAERASPLSASW